MTARKWMLRLGLGCLAALGLVLALFVWAAQQELPPPGEAGCVTPTSCQR